MYSFNPFNLFNPFNSFQASHHINPPDSVQRAAVQVFGKFGRL
jgi:hypothetical protein